MDTPFAPPTLAGDPDADGVVTEISRYVISPRPKPMFHTVLDARRLFADGAKGAATITTRRFTRPRDDGAVLTVDARMQIGAVVIEDRLDCVIADGGMRARQLVRTVGDARREEVDFLRGPFPLPPATYPEVLIPFLMRGQPRDGERRALYSWTADRFVARVYYEARAATTVTVPAGAIVTRPVWMYPDLNDWVSLGSVLTRLARPLLPRYEMWFEDAAPHRLVRFEGAYGPPGAPEVILELDAA